MRKLGHRVPALSWWNLCSVPKWRQALGQGALVWSFAWGVSLTPWETGYIAWAELVGSAAYPFMRSDATQCHTSGLVWCRQTMQPRPCVQRATVAIRKAQDTVQLQRLQARYIPLQNSDHPWCGISPPYSKRDGIKLGRVIDVECSVQPGQLSVIDTVIIHSLNWLYSCQYPK